MAMGTMIDINPPKAANNATITFQKIAASPITTNIIKISISSILVHIRHC